MGTLTSPQYILNIHWPNRDNHTTSLHACVCVVGRGEMNPAKLNVFVGTLSSGQILSRCLTDEGIPCIVLLSVRLKSFPDWITMRATRELPTPAESVSYIHRIIICIQACMQTLRLHPHYYYYSLCSSLSFCHHSRSHCPLYTGWSSRSHTELSD